MKAETMAYLEGLYEKLRQLKKTEKSESWLAAARDGSLVVWKEISLSGLPYAALKQLPSGPWPQVIYAAEDGEKTLVIEEYIQGESLRERLARGEWLTEEEARNIMLQLCCGLSHLHEAGLIHRDIKPSNLILQAGGIVCLIDFDAARLMKESGEEDTRLLGTRGYAPPEQFGYGQTEARSDIYSLGVTMREALPSDYQGYLLGILARCTEMDVKRRYGSAGELARAVRYGKYRQLGQLLAVAAMLAAIVLLQLPAPVPPRQEESQDISSQERTESVSLPQEESQAVDGQAEKSEAVQQSALRQQADQVVPPAPALSAGPAAAPAAAPAREPVTRQEPLVEENKASPLAAEERIYIVIYWNGQKIWQGRNNFDVPINNRGRMISIPKAVWQEWGEEGSPVRFPPDWNLSFHVQNASLSPWNRPRLELSYDDQGIRQGRVLEGGTLQAGEEMTFDIPLEDYSVKQPWVESPSRELHLHLSGEGSQQVFNSDYSVSFLFEQ